MRQESGHETGGPSMSGSGPEEGHGSADKVSITARMVTLRGKSYVHLGNVKEPTQVYTRAVIHSRDAHATTTVAASLSSRKSELNFAAPGTYSVTYPSCLSGIQNSITFHGSGTYIVHHCFEGSVGGVQNAVVYNGQGDYSIHHHYHVHDGCKGLVQNMVVHCTSGVYNVHHHHHRSAPRFQVQEIFVFGGGADYILHHHHHQSTSDKRRRPTESDDEVKAARALTKVRQMEGRRLPKRHKVALIEEI
eukprot:scaffold256_cov261-Pinguiococcus_pyrenoidosus.AAC.17